MQKAECLFQLVIKLGKKPEDASCGSLISLYGKQQKLEYAEKVFATVANFSQACTNLYGSMVGAYNKCSKVEEAYLFYEEQTQEGNDFGPVAISILVNALTNAGKFLEAHSKRSNLFSGYWLALMFQLII